jgi:hypothetical protein
LGTEDQEDSVTPDASVMRGLRAVCDNVEISNNPLRPEADGMASIEGQYLAPKDDPLHVDIRAALVWLGLRPAGAA